MVGLDAQKVLQAKTRGVTAMATSMRAGEIIEKLPTSPKISLNPVYEATERVVLLSDTLSDAIFYDTSTLSPDEITESNHLLHEIREGSLFVVWPEHENKPIKNFISVDTFLEEYRDQPFAVAIPGVGSSSLGTVAFARSVANGIDEMTVGIVAGRGWYGLVKQAIRGYIYNLVARKDPVLFEYFPIFMFEMSSDTLFEIVKKASNIDLIVGHSKGSVIIMNTLNRLSDDQKKERKNLNVVTFGCVVVPPDWLSGRVSQYIGKSDWLGYINSFNTSYIPYLAMPGQILAAYFDIPQRVLKTIHPIPDTGHRIGKVATDRKMPDNIYTSLRSWIDRYTWVLPIEAETILAQYHQRQSSSIENLPLHEAPLIRSITQSEGEVSMPRQSTGDWKESSTKQEPKIMNTMSTQSSEADQDALNKLRATAQNLELEQLRDTTNEGQHSVESTSYVPPQSSKAEQTLDYNANQEALHKVQATVQNRELEQLRDTANEEQHSVESTSYVPHPAPTSPKADIS